MNEGSSEVEDLAKAWFGRFAQRTRRLGGDLCCIRNAKVRVVSGRASDRIENLTNRLRRLFSTMLLDGLDRYVVAQHAVDRRQMPQRVGH